MNGISKDDLERAHALVTRWFDDFSDEAALIVRVGAALEERERLGEQRGERLTRREEDIVRRANKIRILPTAPDPEPPLDPQFDRAIAEAAAALAAAELAEQRVRDTWLIARAMEMSKAREGKPSAAAASASKAAAEDLEAARQATHRCRGRLIRAQKTRDGAKRQAIIDRQPNGKRK